MKDIKVLLSILKEKGYKLSLFKYNPSTSMRYKSIIIANGIPVNLEGRTIYELINPIN